EGQNLACQTQRAHIELVMKAAMVCRHDGLEEGCLAEGLHPRAAGRIDNVVGQCGERGISPARERLGKAAMALVEERPAQRFLEAHGAIPRNEMTPCDPLRSCPRKRESRGLGP